MKWFGRSEKRAVDGGPGDYTEQRIARSEALARGGVDATDLAVSQSCVSLWERAMAAATVEPASDELLPVRDARLLALVGRTLATVGNFVGVIRVSDGAVSLLPASAYDVTGGADPASWIYRTDMAGPSATHTETLPADGIVHVRIGADARTPWRGRSPLQSSPKTTGLAARIESALTAEAALPVGRIAPLDGSAPTASRMGRSTSFGRHFDVWRQRAGRWARRAGTGIEVETATLRAGTERRYGIVT